MSQPHWHVTTLVYAFCGDRLVLLRRRRQPNQGLWSPPGGKVEPGESPLEAALRELREETGLVATRPRLAAIVSEADTEQHEAWLMFAVRVEIDEAVPLHGNAEGDPAWVPLSMVPQLPLPAADLHILDAVLDPEPGVAYLSVRFTAGQLSSVHVRRWP